MLQELPTELAEARNSLLEHAVELVRLTKSTNLTLPRRILRLAASYVKADPRIVNRSHRVRLEQAIAQLTLLRNLIVAVRPEEEYAITTVIDDMNSDLSKIRATKIA